MKALLQTGSSGRVPVPLKSDFLSIITFTTLLAMVAFSAMVNFLRADAPRFLDEIKMVDEGMVADNGLRFTKYQFGPRITPHGDCIKVYGGYIFVTWYRGGMDDRHVMLSRKKIGGDTWRHIEFPHQHVMFRRDRTKGDSHNRIAVGISPKDDTIHLIYDLHAYTPSDFPDDYFNYSYSKKGAALVPDSEWTIDLFHPKQTYLEKKYVDENPRYYWRISYPVFFTADDGDLIVRWRIGGHTNATMYLTKYDGESWSPSHKWNDFERTSGVYPVFGIYNGRMAAVWHRRKSSDHDLGYIHNRGLYFGYSKSGDGLSDWYTYDGTKVGFPITEQEPFLIADPSNPGQRARQRQFVITESGAFHAHLQVNGHVKHYYSASIGEELQVSDGGPDETMYAIGDRVYSISLEDGRPVIMSTEEGAHNWREEYRDTSGKRYFYGNSVMVDGSIFYYLMERGSGDKLPIRVLRFDIVE